ncbi:DUF418 domain-containing protein [Aliikangiella maris]|uniref:DUF418 domain-containing protein n=2 Tax=Aliikangiella maris TaxID=3162458 RepID=A0ABV2BXN2_9GAMM
MNNESTVTTPSQLNAIQLTDRYQSLDFIRGIAVMGILVMNIQAFGNLFASYFNPTVNGDFSGYNVTAWYFTHIFFEQKFYTLFSMLFGAGIMVMAHRSEAKQLSPAKLHYKRTAFLLLFGLAHAFLIWFGDILVAYAIWGSIVYLFWRRSPVTQLIVGLGAILFISLMMLLGVAVMTPDVLAELQATFIPEQSVIDEIVNAYRGTWREQLAQRAETASKLISEMIFFGFRIAGCMLLGMAMYQWGILNGQKSVAFYRNMTLLFLIPGLAIVYIGASKLYASGFQDAVLVQMELGQYNYLGSVFVAIGYVGLFQWIYQVSARGAVKTRIEAVGRMALTNYIAQSIICTGFFYGFGFFAQLSRTEMLLVAACVLIVQIIWSKWWLERFHFGPLEWAWRSLTYGRAQRFKRVAKA